jgi:hypothetical protein
MGAHKGKKKRSKRHAPDRKTVVEQKQIRIVILAFVLIAATAVLYYLYVGKASKDDKTDQKPATTAAKTDFSPFIGDWIRPDGGYIIRIGDIHSDGSVDAAYFNPNRINVAEAKVSIEKDYLKLFIKLQDKGYPGSTYTLYYYADKDALAGFYYQAVMKQTFEVIFVRKK